MPKGIPMPSPTPRLTALGPDEGGTVAGVAAGAELELLGVVDIVEEEIEEIDVAGTDMAETDVTETDVAELLMAVEACPGRNMIVPTGTEKAFPLLQQLVGSGPQQYLIEPSNNDSVFEHGNRLDPKNSVPRKSLFSSNTILYVFHVGRSWL
jgi:hypothetical protein